MQSKDMNRNENYIIKWIILQWENLGIIVIIALFMVLFSILKPNFLTFRNFRNITIQTFTMFFMVSGQSFVLITGGIDLSQGSMVSLATVLIASLVKTFDVFGGLIISLSIIAFFGLINGIIIAKTKLQSFVITLGMLFTVAGIALVYSKGQTIFNIPNDILSRLMWIGQGSIFNIPIIVIVGIISFFILHIFISRTTIGRKIYLLGSNESAAILTGINAPHIIVLAYMLSSILSGLTGFFIVTRTGAGNAIIGRDLLLQSIAAAIVGGNSFLGGKGGVSCAIYGIFFITMLMNGLLLLRFSTFARDFVVGILIIFSIWLTIMRERKA